MSQEKCQPMLHAPRVLLALLFVVGGFGFLTNFAGTAQYVGMGLSPWGLAGVATIATIIAIILKLGGGAMLLLNWKTSTAAWMLIVFTVLATLMYHVHWGGEGGQMQMTQFLKNLAIIGGLLLFAKCPCPSCKQTDSCCSKENAGTPAA